LKVAKSDQRDYFDWDEGREGYVESRNKFVPVTVTHVPKPIKKTPGERHLLSIRAEERVGSLVAAGGTIWAVYVATVDYSNLWRVQIMPPGPVEICALGILAWLHAKWRRSLKV
jgi:hypothetical protein